jgi:hypothetical protein
MDMLKRHGVQVLRQAGHRSMDVASLEDAQEKIDAFRWDYNEHRPHRALKGLSPREYAQRAMTTAADSPSWWTKKPGPLKCCSVSLRRFNGDLEALESPVGELFESSDFMLPYWLGAATSVCEDTGYVPTGVGNHPRVQRREIHF